MYSFMLGFKLQYSPDFEITSYVSGGQCIEHLYQKPDIIILDYKVIGKNLQEVLALVKERSRSSSVILLSDLEELSMLQELQNENDCDFLIKEKDSTKQADLLIQLIKNNIERREVKNREVKRKLITVYVMVALILAALGVFYLEYTA